MERAAGKIIDISLELDPKNFGMRTPAGFSKDLQFAMEVLKEHDAPGGAGQIVRGVHMRLHAGSHDRTVKLTGGHRADVSTIAAAIAMTAATIVG